MCPKQFPLEIVLNLSVPPTRLYHGSPVTAGSLFVGLVEQRASLCRSSLFFETVNNDLPVTGADQRGLNELRLPRSSRETDFPAPQAFTVDLAACKARGAALLLSLFSYKEG